MTAAKPRDSQNPGHLFATANAKRRKAGGPPPGLVTQTAATKVYGCGKPGCKASVRLDASEPLPAGWTVVGISRRDEGYRCPDHNVLESGVK